MMNTDEAAVSNPSIRWFCPTPGRLLLMLLAVEGILILCDWFHRTPKGWAVLLAIAAVAVTIVMMLLWFALTLVFRWRFQFSIRSLLVLTIAVAIPFSWLAVEMKRARRQATTVAQLRKMGNIFEYECELDPSGTNIIDKQPYVPSWLRKTAGDDFFLEIECVYFGEQTTDGDLAFLNEIRQLLSLYLGETQITDAGMEHLKRLNRLAVLKVEKTKISDAGLNALMQLKHMKYIRISGTFVTDAGVAKLQKALPNCEIVH